jgi:hemerythrin superfamily protein
MKITEILREQHNQVRALFKRITAANEASDRPQLLDRLIGELRIHSRLEETIFYPAVRAIDTKKAEETVLESIEEHDIVDFLMARLPAMDMRGERFLARVRVLQSLVEEHAAEEEDQIFKQAEKLGAEELERLGAETLVRIEEIQRVSEVFARVAETTSRLERWGGRWLDASIGLPRRVASALAPSRLLGLDQRAMWVAAIAATTPRWVVDGAYDMLVRPMAGNGRAHANGKRISIETGGVEAKLAA